MVCNVKALSLKRHLLDIEDFPILGKGLTRYLKPGTILLSTYTPTAGIWCGSKGQISYLAGKSPKVNASTIKGLLLVAGTEIVSSSLKFDTSSCRYKYENVEIKKVGTDCIYENN